MGVRDFHAVNLNKDEVVKFVRVNGILETTDDLADGGCLACAWGAGDVYTVPRTIADGSLQV